MPKPKGKAKHQVSALAKAIKTQRHSTPAAADTATVCLDIKTSAATPEFSVEDLGLGVSEKRASTKSGMKTVLGAESSINVERRIRNASVPLGVPIDDQCILVEDLTVDGFEVSKLARQLMPRRPAWTFELSSGRLHHREAQSFKQWIADVRELIVERGGYPPAFEQNLQVWRQLWRVLERCDVAVAVVDARHPLLHLPPALVYHTCRTLQKPLVVVLNKLDAVEPKDAEQWADCLLLGVPGIAGVVGYSREHLKASDFGSLAVGKVALIEACHKAFAASLGASSEGEATVTSVATTATSVPSREAEEARRIMIGLIGHPNVGKSSLVNSLIGEKVVSVKATPGHTKTLQTLALDSRTCLCDTPGVIFPRMDVSREAQIVGMLIPLAQVREPFSAIRWVMEHASAPLSDILGLRPATLQQVLELREAGTDALRLDGVAAEVAADTQQAVPWSPMLLCARYAAQRGLVRAGRPDCMGAGMEILERVLDGRVPYRVRPPTEFRHCSLGRTSAEDDEDADGDSAWQIADMDYESEEEEQDDDDKGLLEVFGVKPREAGSGSIQSRRKQERRKKLAEAEGNIPAVAAAPQELSAC